MDAGFLHLRDAGSWERCDHDGTRVHVGSRSVRLAFSGGGGARRPTPAELEAWAAARGGAVELLDPPDRCPVGGVLLVGADGALLVADDVGERPFPPARGPEPRPGWSPAEEAAGADPLVFGAAEPPEPPAPLGAAAALRRGPCGTLWLLQRESGAVRILHEASLRTLEVVPPPPGARLVDLALTDWGAVAADGAGPFAWARPFGAEWRRVEVAPGGASLAGWVGVAAGGAGPHAIVVLRRPGGAEESRPIARALLLSGGPAGPARSVPVGEQRDPVAVLGLPDGSFLVAEAAGPPGTRTPLDRFTVGPGGLDLEDAWVARCFDGRALCARDGVPFATVEGGLVRVTPHRRAVRTEGLVETFSFDSERWGCAWHRVFVDVCLPPGTSISLATRTSDEPWPSPRGPRPPVGRDPVVLADDEPRLGSRTPEDREGWTELGVLDRRGPWADVPMSPLGIRPPGRVPADGPPDAPAEAACPPPFETLEGLVKSPPGRWLWLRATLRGTRTRSPILYALRPTRPRWSLLDSLPAYWRSDPEAADSTERFLALFEGSIRGLDLATEALPRLLDPRSCAAEALPWLASFVGLVYDERLGEAVRRRLLMEAAGLWRQRGTVPGLRLLCSILSGAETQILEGFRLRRRSAAILGREPDEARGVPGTVLGPSLQLAGPGAADRPWEDYEAELWTRYFQRWFPRFLATAKSEAGGAGDEAFCPRAFPAPPLDPDPLISFHRRFAHRFTVVLFAPFDPELDAVLDAAVEANKPAHTLHSLCWLDPGFRPGLTTYVGIGTRPAGVEGTEEAVLGRSPVGAATTLSVEDPAAAHGLRLGSTRLPPEPRSSTRFRDPEGGSP